MDIMVKALLLYVIAGVVIGGLVASMDKVSFKWMGRPVRFPRVFMFAVVALFWPAALYQNIKW